MLDFEFLSAKAPTTLRHVVYIYDRKSPVLRWRVRKRMIELAKNDGFLPQMFGSMPDFRVRPSPSTVRPVPFLRLLYLEN